MNWIFAALLAPALYGASAFVDRFLIEKHIKSFLFLTILGGVVAFFFGLLIFIFRGFPIMNAGQIGLLIFSGVLFEIALLPYYKAISLEDASRVVPLFQIIPIFVLIFSFFILKEIPARNELVGFFLILCGGFILSVEKFDLGLFKLRKFFWYVMLSGLLYALPGVIFKSVVISENFLDTLIYEFFGGGIGALLLIFYGYSGEKGFLVKIPEVSGKIWTIISFNEGIYVLARFFSFYAISLGPVSLVSVLGGSGPFFVFLYGVILSVWFPQIIKEDISKSIVIAKLIAIGLIFIGVLFINFP